MKAEDRYLNFVRWEDDDGVYVGCCPDLFPWDGVCHGSTEEDAFAAHLRARKRQKELER